MAERKRAGLIGFWRPGVVGLAWDAASEEFLTGVWQQLELLSGCWLRYQECHLLLVSLLFLTYFIIIGC
jgi:hypothetical protein